MADDADAVGAVVEARQIGEGLAAVVLEDLAVLDVDSSSVSRQSAENPGATTAMRLTPLSARAFTVSSV